MIRERDPNKRAALAVTIQGDIEAMARRIEYYALIFARLADAGIVTVPLDPDEPVSLPPETN